jgi:hypothetical protein
MLNPEIKRDLRIRQNMNPEIGCSCRNQSNGHGGQGMHGGKLPAQPVRYLGLALRRKAVST